MNIGQKRSIDEIIPFQEVEAIKRIQVDCHYGGLEEIKRCAIKVVDTFHKTIICDLKLSDIERIREINTALVFRAVPRVQVKPECAFKKPPIVDNFYHFLSIGKIQWRESIQKLGIKILGKYGTDEATERSIWAVYITPAKVKELWALDHIHSITPIPKTYPKNEVLGNLLKTGSVTINIWPILEEFEGVAVDLLKKHQIKHTMYPYRRDLDIKLTRPLHMNAIDILYEMPGTPSITISLY